MATPFALVVVAYAVQLGVHGPPAWSRRNWRRPAAELLASRARPRLAVRAQQLRLPDGVRDRARRTAPVGARGTRALATGRRLERGVARRCGRPLPSFLARLRAADDEHRRRARPPRLPRLRAATSSRSGGSSCGSCSRSSPAASGSGRGTSPGPAPCCCSPSCCSRRPGRQASRWRSCSPPSPSSRRSGPARSASRTGCSGCSPRWASACWRAGSSCTSATRSTARRATGSTPSSRPATRRGSCSRSSQASPLFWSARWLSRRIRIAWLAGVGVLAALALAYPVFAPYSRLLAFEQTPTLDGMRWLERTAPDDAAAIEWLRGSVDGSTTILEQVGPDFDPDGQRPRVDVHRAPHGHRLAGSRGAVGARSRLPRPLT